MAKDIAPSMQFYMRDWMTDSAVQGMTWDQRGRYHWALCLSALSSDPGVASEKQWRLWMHYSERQWVLVRERMSEAFKIQPDGTWIQKRQAQERSEQKVRFEQSGKGGKERAANMTPEQRSAQAQIAALKRWESMRTEQASTTHPMLTPASASASASAFTPENQKPPSAPLPTSRPASAAEQIEALHRWEAEQAARPTDPNGATPRKPAPHTAGPEAVGDILSRANIGKEKS